VVQAAVKAAAACGVPVSFDPNVRLAVEPDVQVWRQAFWGILPHVSLLKMSDEDAGVLSPGVAPADLAESLAGAGRTVAITCGAGGSYVASPSARCHVKPGPSKLIDTIGAGDSYMAALLAWSARGRRPGRDGLDATEVADLAELASAAAAVTCSRPGADPPWAVELERMTAGT
jgi:fructokinase